MSRDRSVTSGTKDEPGEDIHVGSTGAVARHSVVVVVVVVT